MQVLVVFLAAAEEAAEAAAHRPRRLQSPRLPPNILPPRRVPGAPLLHPPRQRQA